MLQVAVFSGVFLGELPSGPAALAMAAATLGVVLLSVPRGRHLRTSWRMVAYGVGCGACFAITSLFFRAASLSLGDGVKTWEAGAWNVFWAQLAQSLLIGGYLLRYQPSALSALIRATRSSIVSGSMGAIASFAWFTAYGMRTAADVRTLGLVEVLFGVFVSHRILRERLARIEWIGLSLVCAGLVVICLLI